MMKRFVCSFGALLVLPLAAEEICRETDEYGNDSFIECSQAQSEGAIPVEIQPVNVADPEAFSPASPYRNKTPSKSAAAAKTQDLAAKQRELEAAKQGLEEAKEVREGDRQGTVTGSRLTQQYFDRVKAAEERVKRAEENIK
jgi:hypothetical protein